VTNRAIIRLLQLASLLMVLLQIGLLFRPDPQFLSRPLFEDAFYAISVGRSIGEGTGVSVDGEHLTNGVQPLICFLYAPIFALSDHGSVTPLRYVLSLQIILYILASIAGATFVRSLLKPDSGVDRRLLWWLTFSFLYVNYALSTHFLNGLETSLTAFLIFTSVYVLRRLQASDQRTLWKWAGLGGLLGLTVLSRVDTVLLVLGMEAWLLREGLTATTLKRVAALGATAVLVSAPWWTYNVIEFGSLMPISGVAQQTETVSLGGMLNETGRVLGDAVVPGIHSPSWFARSWIMYPSTLALIALLIGALFLRRRIRRAWTTIGNLFDLKAAGPYMVFGALLVLFYALMFRAPHFQDRYLVHSTIAILVLEIMLVVSWLRSGRDGSHRWPLVAVVLPLLAASLALFVRNYTDAYGNPMLAAVHWIADNTTAEDSIGMFQSGTTEYVFPHRVTNLDGKVNAAANQAYRSGRLPQYVDSAGFDYIIDWNSYTARAFSSPHVRQEYRRIDSLANGMVVWKRNRTLGDP
jgi:hypothetical protein